jgi:plastocyanin
MRNLKRGIFAGIAVIAMVAAVACTSGSDNTGIADGSDPNIPAGSAFIDQNALRFIPTSLTVSPGQRIYFKNSETALHTITVEGENISGNMRKDEIFIWDAPAALGQYQITCDYHPQMRATITVAEPTPAP